jgi:5,6-dimethylbenzimidazole synthase
MQIDEFVALAKKRRSIRKFLSNPVPPEYIEKILESARWTMSGGNSQPWQFIVIQKQEIKTKLAEIYSSYRELSLSVELTRLEEYRQPAFRPVVAHGGIETVRDNFAVWSGAPVIIAVLGDHRLMQASTLAARLFEMHTFDQNLACAAYNIHLAATALGLGAQWLSLLPPVADAMKAVLAIPLELTLFNLNPIGYPAIDPLSHRRSLSELVHYDAYDMAKFMSNDAVQEFIRSHRERRVKQGKD